MGIRPREGVQVLALGQRADADVVAFFGRIVPRAPPVEARQAVRAEPFGMAHVHAHQVVVQHDGQGAGRHAVVRGQQPAHAGRVVDRVGRRSTGWWRSTRSRRSLWVRIMPRSPQGEKPYRVNRSSTRIGV